MPKATETPRLQGKELLKKLKELNHLSKSEKAKACGYCVTGKDGKAKAKLGEFLEAILDAQGISLDRKNSKDGRGREASYRVTVHRNGSMVIGAAYTKEMGLDPGEEFEIKLGYKHIRLNKLKGEGN
jgi:hypothetical protein